MDRRHVQEWVERYVAAWNHNDPALIGSLFAPDAVYLTGPFDDPWRGRQRIVEGWLENKDEPGTTSFAYEVIAIDGDLAVVQAITRYADPPAEYGNLWLVRLLGDGTASRFEEYWMQKPR